MCDITHCTLLVNMLFSTTKTMRYEMQYNICLHLYTLIAAYTYNEPNV